MLELQQTVDHLEDLVESLRAGTVCLADDRDDLILSPSSLVELEIRGKKKGRKESIQIEVSWRRRPEESPDEAPAFRISAEAPERPDEDETPPTPKPDGSSKADGKAGKGKGDKSDRLAGKADKKKAGKSDRKKADKSDEKSSKMELA